MTTRIASIKIWLTSSLDCLSLRTPVRRTHLGDISYARRVIDDFVLNFVAMATGLVVVEFDWHQSIAHLRMPLTRRKRHHDIFCSCLVTDFFVSNFVAMATRVGPLKLWLLHHLKACPGEPRGRRKHLGDYTRRVIGDFVLNFVAMARRLVVVEFVWHHSIGHSRIPPTRLKRHRDIFYTSGVCFVCSVSFFVAMATRVGRCKIWLTSFDSPTRKTPV